MTRPRIAIVGGGPAGLMAAEVLASGGVAVTLYERMPSVGRKLLMAGRGGLNLTHSEPLGSFLARYREARPRLSAAVEALPPAALREWAEGLGQPTFVGSSGRVFPQAFKASPLLRAWLARLSALGVSVETRHMWTGWDQSERLRFTTPRGETAVAADATVLALGGASWPRLGSDGAWTDVLAEAGVACAPLRPANCGFAVAWSSHFVERFAGAPLKRIALSFGAESVRGEAVITRDGIEGGAVYALSAPLRDALDAGSETRIAIDLRPDVSLESLAQRLAAARGKQSFSNFLRKASGLAPAALGLLNEIHRADAPLSSLAPDALARAIKAVPLTLSGVASITRAISSAGGVAFHALDERFMLRARPSVFVAGEMLDWEAPTGGYLLQACFATGAAAALGVLEWMHERQEKTPLIPA